MHLALRSIGLSSSLVTFKNGPEYLTRGTAKVLISLIRFLLYSLVLSSSLVLLWYSFIIFLSSPLVLCCSLPIFLSICKFPFFRAFLLFLDLVVPFFPLYLVSCFSLLAWHIFLCQISSLCPDCSHCLY